MSGIAGIDNKPYVINEVDFENKRLLGTNEASWREAERQKLRKEEKEVKVVEVAKPRLSASERVGRAEKMVKQLEKLDVKDMELIMRTVLWWYNQRAKNAL